MRGDSVPPKPVRGCQDLGVQGLQPPSTPGAVGGFGVREIGTAPWHGAGAHQAPPNPVGGKETHPCGSQSSEMN